MDSPRPVPLMLRVRLVSACSNGRKTSSRSPGAIPFPVSVTSTLIIPSCFAGEVHAYVTLMKIWPLSVNFTEFVHRLMSTWRTCTRLPFHCEGASPTTRWP